MPDRRRRPVTSRGAVRSFAGPARSKLDGSFHDTRDTKLVADLVEIARGSALVLHHRGAVDHLQISEISQAGENFILYAVGKIDVIWIRAQVFERQHCNTFLRSGI